MKKIPSPDDFMGGFYQKHLQKKLPKFFQNTGK